MPAIDFPASPSVNDEYSFEGRTWLWNGTGWEVKSYPAALQLGSASAPSLYFTGDPNTGIYSPGADQVAISTNGTERARIDSSGRLGLGTSSPAVALDTNGTIRSSTGLIQVNNAAEFKNYEFLHSGSRVGYITYDNTNNWMYANAEAASSQLLFGTANTERLRITSDGKVGIGTSSPWNNQTIFGQGTAGDLTAARQFGVGASSTYQLAIGYYQTAAANPFAGVLQALDNGNGTRLLLNPSGGNVGIGTTSPSTEFHVAGAIRAGAENTSDAVVEIGAGATGNRNSYIDLVADTTYTDYGLRILRGNSGANTDSLIAHKGTGSLNLSCDEAGNIRFLTSNLERARIDSSGRLLVGASASVAGAYSGASRLQSISTSGAPYYVAGFYGYHNDVNPAVIQLGHSRSSSVGHTILQSGDSTGTIRFEGSDGVGFIESASITGVVDGTPGTNDMPGRLVFSTTADGAASPTERMRIDSSGTVTIKTTNKFIQFNDGTNDTARLTYGGTGRFVIDANGPSTQSTEFWINGSEHARIDSSGRLLVGTSTARTNFVNVTASAALQVEGAGNGRNVAFIGSDNAIDGAYLILAKQRSGTVGGNTIVQSGDIAGSILFEGSDGSEFVDCASIQAFVDGTPGTNDMPGRLVFSTTADGAASPTERLRITSAGVLQVADAGNITVGTTTGTKIGTATTQKLGFFDKTPVVQPAAVANATDAASVITQLNALLARMRDLGLIAT